MLDRSIVCRGDIVEDDRQLDGSRHLTLELADAADEWSCTLGLVIDRAGNLHEGFLEWEGSRGGGSAALNESLDLHSEPTLELTAVFLDTESGATGWLVQLRHGAATNDERGAFEATLTPRA